MNRNDLFFALAMLGAGVALGIIGIAMSLPSAVAAEWAAAIGSGLAIIGAIAAPIISRQMERDDRRAERRENSIRFAISLYVPLGLLRADVTRAKAALRALAEPVALVQTRLAQLADSRLRIPDELASANAQLHLLDIEVVSGVQSCIAMTKSFNGMVDAMTATANADFNGFEQHKAPRVAALSGWAQRLTETIEEVTGLP